MSRPITKDTSMGDKSPKSKKRASEHKAASAKADAAKAKTKQDAQVRVPLPKGK